MIVFSVIGLPAPQGSKKPWGGEDNPRTKPWRATVAADAAKAMLDDEIIASGPVKVTARFYFPRPKSHYRTGKHANEVKETAPTHCATKPDLDKLQRAVGDSLSGTVVRDDSQIVAWDVMKLYGLPPRVDLVVEALDAA